MDKTPIGITTHNRIGILNEMLESLSKTIKDVPVTLFQDGSNPEKLDYLNGNLPYPCEVVISNDSIGVVRNVIRVINTLFNKYDSDMIFKIEDDVVFTYGWYDKMLDVARSRDDWGVISGCAVRGTWNLDEGIYSVIGMGTESPFITGQLLLIHRKLLKFLKPTKALCGSDHYLCHSARANGLKTLLIRPGLAQHIGVASECHPKWGKLTDNSIKQEELCQTKQ
jgi:hypothetical protein